MAIYHTITNKLVSIPWDCYTCAIRSKGEIGSMATRLKVKEIAEARGMSQRKLFFRSQVDLKTIQRMFRYPTTTVVTTETLDKLARALNVDVSLLVESDPPLPKVIEGDQVEKRDGVIDEDEG